MTSPSEKQVRQILYSYSIYVPIREFVEPPLNRFCRTSSICRAGNVGFPSGTFRRYTCIVSRTKRLWRIFRLGIRSRSRQPRLKTRFCYVSVIIIIIYNISSCWLYVLNNVKKFPKILTFWNERDRKTQTTAQQ